MRLVMVMMLVMMAIDIDVAAAAAGWSIARTIKVTEADTIIIVAAFSMIVDLEIRQISQRAEVAIGAARASIAARRRRVRPRVVIVLGGCRGTFFVATCHRVDHLLIRKPADRFPMRRWWLRWT